uniref:Uncharacterized protein n=1 Tax=Steinernema glaseri TaxID=37863 RepID=A0A1I7ZW49_9BILA
MLDYDEFLEKEEEQVLEDLRYSTISSSSSSTATISTTTTSTTPSITNTKNAESWSTTTEKDYDEFLEKEEEQVLADLLPSTIASSSSTTATIFTTTTSTTPSITNTQSAELWSTTTEKVVFLHEKCASDRGRSEENVPCNIGVCQYPYPSCCLPFQLIYAEGRFACGPQSEAVIQHFIHGIPQDQLMSHLEDPNVRLFQKNDRTQKSDLTWP